MILTYNELVKVIEQGVINAPLEQVNAASIDVRLGNEFFVENSCGGYVNLANKSATHLSALTTADSRPLSLHPGAFVLGSTIEQFNLPNDIACEFKLKSSIARAGLDHALAGWGDPGWHGSVMTLEFKNNLQYHTLLLQPGMLIGQVVFWRGAPVPDHASYRRKGRYNNDKAPQPAR